MDVTLHRRVSTLRAVDKRRIRFVRTTIAVRITVPIRFRVTRVNTHRRAQRTVTGVDRVRSPLPVDARRVRMVRSVPPQPTPVVRRVVPVQHRMQHIRRVMRVVRAERPILPSRHVQTARPVRTIHLPLALVVRARPALGVTVHHRARIAALVRTQMPVPVPLRPARRVVRVPLRQVLV